MQSDKEVQELQSRVDSLIQQSEILTAEQTSLDSTIQDSKATLKTLDKDTELQVRQIKDAARTKKSELETRIRDAEREINRNKSKLEEFRRELQKKNDELTAMQRQVRDSIEKAR